MHTTSTSNTFRTSHILHTSHTILHTSHTSQTSHTSHTSHTSRTSHPSYPSHTSQPSHTSTPHITLQTPSPTTPAFAAVAFPCYLDSELRALWSNSEDASLFCPLYLDSQSQILLPTYVGQFGRPQIESACSCFDHGDKPAGSTAPTVRTEAEFVLTSTAPSSSTIVSTSHHSRPSSKPSTSTARGSVIQGNRSNSASNPPPGRFAVFLVSVLVIFLVVALLNDLIAI